MNPLDQSNQEVLASWFTNKSDILPSRARAYAKLLVQAGIGSISRLTKKLTKNQSFLLDLGFDADDAEEIVTLILKGENSSDLLIPIPQKSSRVLEALSGKMNYSDLEKSRILISLCLQYRSKNLPSDSLSLPFVGELILPFIQVRSTQSQPTDPSSSPSGKIQIQRTRSESMSSLSATSFDRAFDDFNDENQPHVEGTSNEETKTRKLPIRSKVMLNNNALVMSKEHMEIASSSLALVSGFVGYENLSIAEIVALLENIISGSQTTSDKSFYLNCLSQLEICKHISFILSFFLDSSDICRAACRCISLFCQFGEDRKTINLENIEEFGFYGVCDLLSRLFLSLVVGIHSTDLPLTQSVCDAIAKLAHLEQNIIDFISSGVCDAVNSLLETLSFASADHPLLLVALICARNLSQHENAAQRFLVNGFQNNLVQALLSHSRDELVSTNAIRAIIMMGNASDGSKILGVAGASNAIILSMTGNDGCATVVEWALMAIEMLLSHKDNLHLLLQTSICEVLVYCLDRNYTVPSIARGSGRVVQLLAADQVVRSKLGFANACAVFSKTLNYHLKTPSIAQVCCGAIGSLAADHEINRQKLMGADAGKFVLDTLQRYSSGEGFRNSIPSGYETVTWQACWALRKLSAGGSVTALLEELCVCETLSTVGRRYINLADIMIQIFRLINTLCSQPTSVTILNRIGHCGLCKTIVKCLSKHTQNSVVCSVGVDAIGRVACLNDNIEKFINARASETIVEIMEIHSGTEPDLTVLCCQALDILAASDFTCARVKNAGGAQAILWALQRQMQNEAVVVAGCKAMCTFLIQPVNRPFFGSNGGCEIIVAALKQYHSVPTIVEINARAIHFLALDANNRAWLGASGGCHVVYSLKAHADSPAVCAAVCAAISSLADSHEGNNKRLGSLNACEVIIRVMRMHVHHDALIREGNLAIYRLAEFPEGVGLLNQAGAITCTLENLIHHKSQSLISKYGFQALSRLSDPRYNAYALLMEAKINSSMILLLESVSDAPVDVLAPGLDVIVNLVAVIENRKLLGEEGICEVLNTLLRVHSTVFEIVRTLTRIILSITSCEENTLKLLQANVCDSLLQSMQCHRLEDDLCSDICQALVQLSSKSPSASLFSEPEGILTISRHLVRIKDQEHSVLLLLRLLTFLCGSEIAKGHLVKSNGIKILSSMITQHINNLPIVQQALEALLSIACGPQTDLDTFSRITSFESCEALSHALRAHGKDPTLFQSILTILLWITTAKIAPDQIIENDLDQSGGTKPVPATAARPLWRKITSMFSSSNRQSETPNSSPTSVPSSPSKKKLLLDENSSLLSNRLGAARICEALLQSITHNIESEKLVVQTCKLLAYLIQTDENIDFIQRSSGCDVLVLLWKSYPLNERTIRLLCPILEALISFSVRKNATLVISKSQPSNGHLMCELGLSSSIIGTIQEFVANVDTISLLLPLLHQLARSSSLDQTTIVRNSPDCFGTFMTILSSHSNNPAVIIQCLQTLIAILSNHHENILHFVTIADISIFAKLLSSWGEEVDIIQCLFWIFKMVGPVEVAIPSSPSPFLNRQPRKQLHVHAWINTDIEDLIMRYFIKHSQVDHQICQYGCDLLGLMLDPTPYDFSFFQSSEQIDRCQHYSTRGVTRVLVSIFEHYLSREEVIETAFLLAALLTRRIDNISLRPYVPVGSMTNFHDNLSQVQPTATLPIILRALEKYPSHQGINRSSLFLLNNLLVDHNLQGDVLASLKPIWRAVQSSMQDPHALRYSCNIISTLASTEASSQVKLIALGTIPIVLHALRIYRSAPQTVHDASLVITTLSHQNPTAKDKICSMAMCETLVETLEAYSLNEFVAIEICRCIAMLMEDSPTTICMKFNDKNIGPVVVGLLQSFGCGRESDQSAVVAEWCSRIIYCVATTPVLARSGSSSDSYDDKDDRKSTQPQNWAIRLGNLGAGETLVLVIEKFSNRKDVAMCACKALLALSAEHDNARKLVLAGAKRVLSLLISSLADETVLMDYVKIILSRIDQVDGGTEAGLMQG
jgi:hypothetical protein